MTSLGHHGRRAGSARLLKTRDSAAPPTLTVGTAVFVGRRRRRGDAGRRRRWRLEPDIDRRPRRPDEWPARMHRATAGRGQYAVDRRLGQYKIRNAITIV
jgi:hypothetical protein